jgi:hypothetical protein
VRVDYKHIHLLTPHSQLVTALHSSSPVTPSITYYYITTPFSISYFLVNNHQSHRNEYRTAKTLNIPSHNYRSIYPQPSLTTSIQKQQQQELRPAPPQVDTPTPFLQLLSARRQVYITRSRFPATSYTLRRQATRPATPGAGGFQPGEGEEKV